MSGRCREKGCGKYSVFNKAGEKEAYVASLIKTMTWSMSKIKNVKNLIAKNSQGIISKA